MAKNVELLQARRSVLENLARIKVDLALCIQDGLSDASGTDYNEILDLIEEVKIVNNWDDLSEAVIRAKTLEIEIAGWLSRHGRTSVSLPWPKRANP
jgi:hypothetical protein